MFKVYLAGPIGGLSYEEATNGWRKHAKERLEASGLIRAYSPMRYKEALSAGEFLARARYDFPLATPHGILERDHYDVMSSDLLLVNLAGSTKVSIGTMVELGMAYAYRKPMVFVNDRVDAAHYGPFIQALSKFNYNDLDKAIDASIQILCP